MKKKGILVVVSGFSGSGKGTVMKELLRRYDNYALSVSATTREPREDEVDGREYFFRVIAQEGQFEIYIEDELILQGSMLTAEKIMPGLVCGRGNAEIKNFTVYELEK